MFPIQNQGPAFQNCPPIPSPTQTQGFIFGTQATDVPIGGSFSISVGVTLGPFPAGFSLVNIQQALNQYFPGAICFGTVPVTGQTAPAQFFIKFFQDPGLAATINPNTLTGPNGPITVTVSPNPFVLYPNYSFLTSRWAEFLIPGTPTALQLQTKEQQIFTIKQDAFSYVRPENWRSAFNQAVFLRVAHLLKISKDPVGFITQQRAKNLGESYATDTWLAGTVYGQEFIRLRKARILTVRYVKSAGILTGRLGYESGGFEGPHTGDYQPIN